MHRLLQAYPCLKRILYGLRQALPARVVHPQRRQIPSWFVARRRANDLPAILFRKIGFCSGRTIVLLGEAGWIDQQKHIGEARS